VDPAEGVGAPHPVHPGGEDGVGVSDRPSGARQGGPGTAKGRGKAFNLRRGDVRPAVGRGQDDADRLARAVDDPSAHPHDVALGVRFDDLGDQQALLGNQTGASPAPGVDRCPKDPRERPHVAGQPLDADLNRPGRGAGTDFLRHGGDQVEVAVGPDYAAQPQTGGNGQRQRQPDFLPDQLHPEFIGLAMLDIHVPLSNEVRLDRLALLTRARWPIGHRTLIDPKGRHDGVERTAMADQDQPSVTVSTAVRRR